MHAEKSVPGYFIVHSFVSAPPVNASCAGPKAPPVERQVSRNLSLWEKRAAAAQQDEDDEGSTSLRKHYSCLNIFGYSLCIALVVM